MPRLAMLLLVVLAGAVVILIWIQPLFSGPSRVDCGPVDANVCDEVWRAEAAQEVGVLALLPVTAVEVHESQRGPSYCYEVMIERLVIRKHTSQLCPL